MNIENFADLLQAARTQALPQRLLLVFASVELPDDASPAQRAGFEAGQGGALVPALCVDKSPYEVPSFEALVQEATQLIPDWRFVVAAAMSADPQNAASLAEVDACLQAMVQAIKRGDMGRYLVFDRKGLPLVLQ